jgi:hypothetical protein
VPAAALAITRAGRAQELARGTYFERRRFERTGIDDRRAIHSRAVFELGRGLERNATFHHPV